MSIADSFFYALDQLRLNAADMFGGSANSFTKLYTTDSDANIVSEDSSMVSLIDLQGSLKMIGDEEFEDIADRLVTTLKTPLSKNCHAIQFVFQYDPEAAKKVLAKNFQIIRNSSKNLGMDLEAVLIDWENTLASYCADEQMKIAVWTRPNVISDPELKAARKELKRKKSPYLTSNRSQGRNVIIQRMRDMHQSATKSIIESLKNSGYKIKLYSCPDAIAKIRQIIAPNSTADDWRPKTWDSKRLPVRDQSAGAPERSLDNFFPPSVSSQVWPSEAMIIEKKYVAIDGRIYAPIIMTLPPEQITPFNNLFQALRMDLPWRCSILLRGGGLKSQRLKSQLSQALFFTSDLNKQFNHAYEKLYAGKIKGELQDVNFQVTFTTWVDVNNCDSPLKLLSQRAARLATAIQSWGSCDTSDLTGDPLLAFTATVPACMPTSPAPAAIAPLQDAVDLLPIFRPCSPWPIADLPLRTPDGKFMPVGLMSSNQASWNDIVFAAMGQGKSFFLNTSNLFFLIRPQPRLPRLTVIDIGPSGSGLVNLIQIALPPQMRHLAVYAKLRNTKDAAVNPFDTPLGVFYPFPSHMEFLVNLLSLLCTPLDRTNPTDGISGILRDAIKETYLLLSPEGTSPKRYYGHLDNEIQAALEDTQFDVTRSTSWWDVVLHLFKSEKYPLAIRAQQYAMPVIQDIISAINSTKVKAAYEKITIGNSSETVPQACARYLATAMDEYPILSNPTKFSLGAAHVIVLDLQDVTAKGSAASNRKTAIMYMVARQIGAGHFFYSEDDLEYVPNLFRDYHKPDFISLAADPKRLYYDEFHRASEHDENSPLLKQIISDLSTASRESRKHNISIGLCSQRLEDFPKVLVDLATNIYVLGANNAQQAEEIGDRFGLNPIARLTLKRITKPTAAGANFLGVFRTSDGESLLYLTNCAGKRAKWAFSTTSEDMRVRNRLYSVLGCKDTLEVLSTQYPSGTIKDELERRHAFIQAKLGEKADDFEQIIFEELLAAAKKSKHK